MKLSSVTTTAALAVLAVSLFTAAPSADASIISMQFTGTVAEDFGSGPVFGESGTAIPFNFSLVYDTSLGAQMAFLPNPDPQGGGEDVWGYSATGITSLSLTFGTKTWTLEDLQPVERDMADFWANADLTVAAPTAVAFSFGDADGRLMLGSLWTKGIQYVLRNVYVEQYGSGDVHGSVLGTYELSTSVTPSAVPEPASLLLLGSGLLGLAARRRSSKRALR